MKYYHISENPNLTQLIPKIPKSLYNKENKITPRACFSSSIKGCCIAIPSSPKTIYTIYEASLALLGELGERDDLDNIMIKANITDVPDAEFTEEFWFTGLGIEIVAIGQIKIIPNNIVLGEAEGYPVLDYDYKWINKFQTTL